MAKKLDKKTAFKKTAGDQRISRFTDKSNSYEERDFTENEPPNSVFSFNKGKMKGSTKK